MWGLVAAFTGPIVVLLLGILGVLYRATVKWTQLEGSVRQIEKSAVAEQESSRRVHLEIWTQMREDRAATDRRLRWLEENVWNHAVDASRRPH